MDPLRKTVVEPALVVRTSVADEIARILEREILAGEYARDERLQQEELCRRFGVSRTPAREALRKLQALGLVELRPNRGAVVNRPTLDELQQTYEVRAELEGFAAALAARHRDANLLEQLERTHTNLEAAVMVVEETGSSSATIDRGNADLRELNDKFHGLVHTGSQNERLIETIRGLERYFPKDVVFNSIRDSRDLHRFYVMDHGEILYGIRAGIEEQARTAMRQHIDDAQGRLLQYLKTAGYH